MQPDCRSALRAARRQCRATILTSCGASPDIGATCVNTGPWVEPCKALSAEPIPTNPKWTLTLSLDGKGFFVLAAGRSRVYATRDDVFVSGTGDIVDRFGLPLMGSPLAFEGTIAGAPQSISIAGIASQAKATTTVSLAGNLQSDAALKTTGFDTGAPSFANAYAASNFVTSIRVFDTLGAGHDLTVFFRRTAPDLWDVHTGVDGGETWQGTAGALKLIDGTGGSIAFNQDGSVQTTTGLVGTVQFAGVAAQTIALQLGGMTQFASATGITEVVQNGFGAGGLVSLTIEADGVVRAMMDTGQSRPLYRLTIAHFAAPALLRPCRAGMYRGTLGSGPPALGSAREQGNGSVVTAGSL